MRTSFALGSLLLAAAASAATFTVTTTADAGAGSLRQAILDANANPGADTIAFAIPGAGVHTISPVTALPNVTQPVTIDGYTQPGSAPNTDPIADDAIPLIELEGSGSSGSSGLRIMLAGAGSTVRGLVLNRWPYAGLELLGGAIVAGCFIGTDPAGLVAPDPNVGKGISASGASTTIGGLAPADRNLISGNTYGVEALAPNSQILGNLIGLDASGEKALPNSTGLSLSGGANVLVEGNVISGNIGTAMALTGAGTIQGNIFGLSASGAKAIGNGDVGVAIASPQPVLLGGAAAGEGNVISANRGSGVNLSFSDDAVVQGNLIGTDPTGTLPFGNATGGIRCVTCTNSVIGGPGAGEGNTIAFNGAYGVTVYNFAPAGNVIRGNSIHSNGPTANLPSLPGLAIDLGIDGPTANDPADADGGPNQLQNSPHVASAVLLLPSGAGTHVQGVLHSTPSTEYTLDFYSNPACAPRPRAFLQAKTYLGSALATTDGNGDAAFDVVVPGETAPGEPVTATATDPSGNTSEVSARIVYSILPGNGPAGGGTNLSISGTEFESGATVTIGGQPAGNVVVVDGDTITAASPALPAGSVGDVTVTNPSGLGGTYARGFVSDFLDAGGVFYPYIVTLVGNGVTAGCGGGNYCPDANVTRAQMAAFLLKAKHGLCYTPPPCTGTFGDVACPSLFANWIEALAAEGITGGCGGGNYCPGNAVRRDQMAAFLLKAEHGSTYLPPSCTGVFTDVACPSQFAAWIEQLATEQITGGCGGGAYCPLNPNTRGQMAVFLVKTFELR
jgi:IPT/TIG domain/Right handed beta helix region/S-layer homology domain